MNWLLNRLNMNLSDRSCFTFYNEFLVLTHLLQVGPVRLPGRVLPQNLRKPYDVVFGVHVVVVLNLSCLDRQGHCRHVFAFPFPKTTSLGSPSAATRFCDCPLAVGTRMEYTAANRGHSAPIFEEFT